LTQNNGGSGTFYYVVVALSSPNGYIGTNGILLGDRIAPQTTEIKNGQIIVNYADRKTGEAMTIAPSVGVSKYLNVNGNRLIEITNPNITSNLYKNLECHDSPKYFAIQKGISDSAGSDILIKYDTNPSQNFPCAYTVASGDFEIKNVMAEYFLAFTENFLLLDSGTAPPPRGLIVYDLRSRKIVFTDSYTKPVLVEGDNITYLSKTDQKPTLQNCPDLDNYTKNGLGAVIMSKITVNLLTLNKKDLGTTQCLATQ
jgi:hypothetical protein